MDKDNTSPSAGADEEMIPAAVNADTEEDNNAPTRLVVAPPVVVAATEEDVTSSFAEEKKVETPDFVDVKLNDEETTADKDDTAVNNKQLENTTITKVDEEEELSAEDKANCLSSWLLLYLSPLLKLGATKVLEPADVGPPAKCDRAVACYDSVYELWKAEVARTKEVNERNRIKHQAKLDKLPPTATKKRAKIGVFKPQSPNIAKVLWNAFGFWRIWYAIVLYILSALLQFMPVVSNCIF